MARNIGRAEIHHGRLQGSNTFQTMSINLLYAVPRPKQHLETTSPIGRNGDETMKAIINIYQDLFASTFWESRNDDHPTTTYKDGVRVEVQVETTVNWGPFKTRRTARRVHSGNTKVLVRYEKPFISKEESLDDQSGAGLLEEKTKADAYALRLMGDLESKGFTVELAADKQLFKKERQERYRKGEFFEEALLLEPNSVPERFRERILREAGHEIRKGKYLE